MINRRQENMWVLLAQSGDKEALDQLLKAVQEPLYRYILSLIGNQATAEDVLQEVFIKIYRKLFWLRQVELFRPWTYRIASREAFKFLAKERKWSDQVRDELVLETITAPEIDKDLAMDFNELSKLIENVSPASRAVIVLHYLHEMSLDEVADVLGIALGTVKSRLAYGLSCLRSELAKNNK
jgi:RNA polymerase sigma-70 factor, ECF subfamily